MLSGKKLGDNFTPSLYFVLGAYDIEFLSKKHISLVTLAFILVFITIFSLAGTFVFIRKLKLKGKFKEALIHFNFFVLGFKEEFYFWPFYIWIRKILVTSFIILLKVTTNPVSI